MLGPSSATIRGTPTLTTRLSITLTEGRNRQLRRMFDAVGHPVARLHRVSFGGLTLGTLGRGEWRPLTAAEVARLKAGVGEPARQRHPGADRGRGGGGGGPRRAAPPSGADPAAGGGGARRAPARGGGVRGRADAAGGGGGGGGGGGRDEYARAAEAALARGAARKRRTERGGGGGRGGG